MEFLRKTRKKRLSILLGLSSSIIIAAVLILFFGGKDAIAAWFDESWAFRRRIPVTNNTTAETNVYVTIANIDTSDTAKFQADCGDIRFTKENGQLLDYYIVSGCGTATTTLHVQFDTLIAGVQDIYMYYGNPSAANGFTGSDFSTQASNYSVGSLASEEKSLGPVAHWKFDEGYGNTANNSTSRTQLNGTITNATWQSEDKCVSGKCLYFDGSGDYVIVNDPSNGALDFDTNSFTISVWVRTEDNIGEIIHKMEGATAIGYQINLADGWGGDTYGMIDDGPNQSYRYGKDGSGIYNNNWHQIIIVFDRSQTYPLVYLDGRANTGSAGGVTPESLGSISNAANFYIGGNTSQFKGFIDDVKIYSYARSATQIKSDYVSRGSSKGAAAVLGGDSDKWLSDGLVGYWKMDESSWTNDCTATSVTDSSGNGNNGKSCPATTGPTGGAAGKFGNAGSFDGTEDYVDAGTGSSLSFSNGITISTWIKKTANGSAYKGVVDKGRDGYGAWSLNADETPYKLTFKAKIGGTNYSVVANSTYTAGQWEHYTGVFDGTKLLIYRNGELSNTTSASGALGTNSVSVRIGATNDGLYFDGSTDDVRIYNRAFSPKEVRDLYSWAPGPVGYWNMDEKTGQSAYDSSGNNSPGTLGSSSGSDTNDPAWTTAKFGGGLNFDGSNDYVDVTRTTPLDNISTFNFTVEGWFKGSTTGTYQDLIGKPGGSSSNNVFQLITAGDGSATVALWIGNGAGGNNSTGYQSFGNWGNWHHVAGTSDGTNLKIYIDGILKNTANITLSSWTNTSNVKFGTTSYPFKGILDDVRVYNYARTQKQIVEDMNAGHPAPGSPVGSAVGNWKFDEGYGNTTNNSGSGGSALNGTITNATWSNSGKYGKALSFDGTGDYVGITHNQGSTLKSVSAWFKLNSMPTGTPGGIVLATASSVSGPTGFDKLLRVTTAGKIEFYFNDGVGRNATGTTTLTTGVWYYAAGVTEGSRTVVYLNGKEEGSYASVSTYTTGNYAIIDFDDTAYSTYAQDINALIDEVKIYNSALTSDEIKLDYNRGAALVMGATSTDSSGNPDNSSAREYCIPGDTTSCSAPVAEWKMDEGTGGYAYDTSGNANTGTWSGTGSRWTSGKFGKAGKFNGSDDKVSMTSAITQSTGSYSFWIYPTDITSEEKNILAANDNYSRIQFSTNSRMSIETNTNGQYFDFIGYTFTTNRWYFIEITRSGDTAYLYVDGILKSTVTVAGADSLTIDSIGGKTSVRFFKGILDQVRIFNYARTAAQIAWDYNRGGPVGWWKMDECQGGTANDASGNGNNGTITIGATGSQASVGTCAASAATAWYNGATGKRNASLNFDGTDDFINVNDNTILRMGTSDWTTSAWIKSSQTSGTYQIIDKRNSGPTVRYQMTLANGKLFAELRSTAVPDVKANVTGTKNIADGLWHHVVATFTRSSNLVIYVDGTSDGSVSIASMNGVDINGSSEFKIGAVALNNTLPFNGQIDDVRAYNYALTQQQIRDIYNGGAVRYGPATGSP